MEEVLSTGPSRRLLDLGCGTGEHSRFLVSRGFEVVGIDRSPSMLERARELAQEPGVEFIEGDIRRVGQAVEGPFGGALCLGNTLPHLRQPQELADLFGGLRRLLEPGAPLLIQMLNYERIFERRERYLPLDFRRVDDEEIVFLRLMDFGEDGEVLFYPSTLRLLPGEDPPLQVKASKKVHLRGWRRSELSAALTSAGFEQREEFGDFARSPFDPSGSRDLIVIAR